MKMKSTGILLLSAGIFFSCATTYYQAGVRNQKRFKGQEMEDADYLMRSSDDLLLLKTLSVSGKDRTNSKNLYLRAEYLIERIKDHEFKVQLVAKSRRISLATELSQPADDKLHLLLNYDRQLFDSIYFDFVIKRLKRINDRSHRYKMKGNDQGIKNLSVNLEKMTKDALLRFSDEYL